MRHRSLAAALLGTALLLGLAGDAPVPASGQGVVDQNQFLDLLPALRTAPAPQWLRPGVRITLFSAAAVIVGERNRLIEDPQGNWVDRATGKRFREENIPLGVGGGGGAGFTVINVVYLDRSIAVLEIRSYGMVLEAGSRVTPIGTSGAVGIPGAGSDFWLHPQVLARAPGIQLGQELQVLRMGYTLNNRQFTVIRFQGRGQSWNYEESTGILARSTASAEGSPVLVPNPSGVGAVTRPGGGMITQNTIADVRTVAVPWANMPVPGWVASARRLRYEGTWTMHVPGSPVFPLPMSMTFERQYFGGRWARYIQRTFQPSPTGQPTEQQPFVRVFGPAQIGGLWIPPEGLAQLRPGQVLDQDPVTQIVTKVAGDFGGGRAISEINDIHRVDYVYDRRNGMLVLIRLTDHVLRVVLELSLTSVQ